MLNLQAESELPPPSQLSSLFEGSFTWGRGRRLSRAGNSSESTLNTSVGNSLHPHHTQNLVNEEGFFSTKDVTDSEHHPHLHAGNEFEQRKEHSFTPSPKFIIVRRWKRIAIICCCVFLLLMAVLVAIVMLVVVPAGIKSSFWGGPGNYTLALNQASDWHLNTEDIFPINTGIHGSPTVGSWTFSFALTYSVITTPFNLLLRLYGSSAWELQIPPSFIQHQYPDINETPSYPVLGGRVPADMLVTGGAFIINSTGVIISALREKVPTELPELSSLTWPGGYAVARGFVRTFMTDDPTYVPRMFLISTSNFAYGAIYAKGVTITKPFTFGNRLVRSGLTLPQLTQKFNQAQKSDPSSAPTSAFFHSFNITSLSVNSVSPPNITISFDLFVQNPLIYGITFNNLYLSTNLSGTPLADGVIRYAHIPYGEHTASLTIEAALGFNISDIGKIASSIKSDTMLGINSVHMKPGPTTPPSQFVNDLLSAVDLNIPVSLFGLDGGSSSALSGGNKTGGNGLGRILANLVIGLDYVGVSGFTDAPAPGYVGGINLALNATISNISVPLAGSIGPIEIATPLIVKLEASSTYGVSSDGSGTDDGDYVSFLELYIQGPLQLMNGQIVIASETAAQLRFPTFPKPSSNIRTPLASAFFKGLAECLSTADASKVPRIRVSTDISVSLGSLTSIPAFPLQLEFDLGEFLVNHNWTLPGLEAKIPPAGTGPRPSSSGTSTSTSTETIFTLPTATTTTPSLSSSNTNPFQQLAISVSNIITLSSVNTLATADFTITLPKNPLELLVHSLRLQLTLNSRSLAYIQLGDIHAVPGDTQLTAHGQVLAPWSQPGVSISQAVGQIVELLNVPFREWVLGVGGISVVDGNGVGHVWLDEVLGGVELSVPWLVVYNDALKQLFQGFLKKISGGAFGG